MHEIEKIEQYLLKRGNPEEHLLMEAKMQLDSELADQVALQKQTYKVIVSYGRQQLRQEIQSIDRKVFRLPVYASFRSSILSIFKKS